MTYPDEAFQAAKAALEQLDDAALWSTAIGRNLSIEITRYDELLKRNQERALTDTEQLELTNLHTQADRFMQRNRPSCCFTALWASSPSCRTQVFCLYLSWTKNLN